MKKYRKKIINLLIAAVLVTVITITGISPLQAYASDTLGDSMSSGNDSDTSKGDSTLNTATIYQLEYYSSYVYIDVYEYSGASELLAVHQKGTALNNYVSEMDGAATYLYIKNSAGVVTAPTVTYVTRYTFNASTGEVTEVTQGTEIILSSLSYYPKMNKSKCYGWYIEGDYETLAYTPSKFDEDGHRTTTITYLQAAEYWFNSGGYTLNGWRAFSFNINSRAALNSFYGSTKAGTYALSNASLSGDGIFSYEGLEVGYTSDMVWRGGVSVEFYYTRDGSTSWQTSFYYYYQLPLEGGQYEFNFADLEHIKLDGYDYSLAYVYITPVIQYNWASMQTGRTAMSFSYDELSAAGCFEEGGDPVLRIGSVSKGDTSVGRPSGDPSLEGSDSGNYKGDTIESPGETEWDSSEHGFWENALHYLSNMASNIANLGNFVIDKLGGIFDMAKNFVSDLTYGFSASLEEALEYYFVPDMTEYNARFDELVSRFGFIDSISSVVKDIFDYLTNNVETSPPVLTIPLKSDTFNINTSVTIDFSWYEPFKPAFDILIAGFLWIGFVYTVWRKAPDIIAGVGMNISSGARAIDKM